MKKILLLVLIPFCWMSVWADGFKFSYDDEFYTATIIGYSGGYPTNLIIPETVSYSGKNYTVRSIESLYYNEGDDINDIYDINSLIIPQTVTSVGTRVSIRSATITMPENLDVSEASLYLSPQSEHMSELIDYHVLNGREIKISRSRVADWILDISTTITAGNTFSVVPIIPDYGDWCIPENWVSQELIKKTNSSLYFQKDGFRYHIINESKVSVAYLGDPVVPPCSKYRGDIVIPSAITTSQGDTFQVTSIDEGAFVADECGGYLSSITFPDNISGIFGAGIFFIKNGIVYRVLNNNDVCVSRTYNYSYTGDIIIPSIVTAGNTFYVKSIEEGAFSESNDVVSITIPDNLDVSKSGLAFTKNNIIYRVLSNSEVAACRAESTITDAVILNTIIAGMSFSVNSIEQYAFSGCTSLKSVVIPETIKKIKESAFSNCTNLTSITIPESVASIGINAFEGCTKLTKVTCMSSTPPKVNSNSFANYNSYLYVPCESKETYDLDAVWGNFKHIECIGSETIELTKDEVAVVPEKTEAEFSMPKNENANSYTLTISNNGVTFCTLSFNAQGQLANIDFSTTKSYELKSDVEGFKFTVTGLSTASDYGYSFKALASNKSVLKEYSGSFTTKNEDGTGGSVQGGGEGTLAVEAVSNATAVTIVNDQILVNGEAPAFVVTVSGQKIANANLKAGVYFVVIDGETVKVVK